MPLAATRDPTHERTATLTPVGEIDLHNAKALGTAIEDALRTPRCTRVVVDLRSVTFLACAGISVLVAGRNTAARRGQQLTIVNAQRHVHRILELTGVLAVLTDPAMRRAPSDTRP